MSDQIQDAVVRQMRDAIIDNDVKLLEAVNRRIALVRRLRGYKEDHGIAFVDPERERWMHRYVAATNRGPLSDEGLRDFYAALLDLTKRESAGT